MNSCFFPDTIMPSEDYASVSSGALRLKGVSTSSKIHKHKKKRPKTSINATTGAAHEDGPDKMKDQIVHKGILEENPPQVQTDSSDQDKATEELEAMKQGKTEAELRHEERRRKRLDERLKREGTKTHKERVEELNRYLSNLSEHHDMYAFHPSKTSPPPSSLLTL